MLSAHPFGDVFRRLRLRIPGLTQARVAELAGYDPAVITRMTQGKQDLTGPYARERVLHIIQALDEAGALRGLEDANGLLAAANLSPLIQAKDVEAELIQRISLHSDLRGLRKVQHGYEPLSKTPHQMLSRVEDCIRAWDRANSEVDRILVLATVGNLAFQNHQVMLGVRLLARAALDETQVAHAPAAQRAAFAQHIHVARSRLDHTDFANAWFAGQLLTLKEARAWLAAFHAQLSR